MHDLQQEFYNHFTGGSEAFDDFKKTCLNGMWYWDLEHREHAWLSPGFWHALGYDPAEMPQQAAAWQLLIHPDDRPLALSRLETHLADPSRPYDVSLRYKHGKTGRWVWMRCRGVALCDATGKPVRMVGAHLDVTSLRETENALRATVEDLLKARVDLQAALQAKTAFLEAMSHEIRTPMNGIIGMAEALVLQELPLAATTQVAVINRSARALLSLLSDGLDAAQLEARKALLKMETLRLMDVIRTAVAPFEVVARDTGRALVMRVAHDLPERVIASARAIGDVFGALLGNAVTHAQHGDIEVRVNLAPADMQGTRTLRLSVIDAGIGITEAQKSVIVQKFAQSDVSQGPAPSGSGFGLVAARKLCQQHGGDLRLSETFGGGTTIEAAFVVQEIAPVLPRADARGTAPKAPLRILVVEDDEMNQLVLEALLGHVNAQIVFASDGRAALDLVRDDSFDAGFVDISMPIMSGTEFAQEWRRLEAERGLSRLPLIACSGHVLPHQVESCLATGFDRHLPKPVTMDGLLACIHWIRSQRAQPVV